MVPALVARKNKKYDLCVHQSASPPHQDYLNPDSILALGAGVSHVMLEFFVNHIFFFWGSIRKISGVYERFAKSTLTPSIDPY